MQKLVPRRLTVGAELAPGGVHFRVWAPPCQQVAVVFEPSAKLAELPLTRDADGYHSGLAAGAAAGMRYQLRLDGSASLWPDPASRYQPQGPDGPSEVIDPDAYHWHDGDWMGPTATGQVLYEMHIGTFTPEGTWNAAARQLAELAALGVTALEIMPIAEFPGRFGWSYDTANLFAPSHLYGTPDDVRAFVDEAHRVGIGVILDVVYNHFGSVGERLLKEFSDGYFSKRYECEWGSAINFDDEDSAAVREFFLANVEMWIAEYHFDGVRIDATQAFHDASPTSILCELGRRARSATHRRVLVVGESEPQRGELFRPADEGGCELDALWSDDFHHAALVRLTGRREAYYTDYRGTADEFVAAARFGFLFQGQRYAWQDKPRGSPALDVRAWRFIHYLENHDQLANSPRGERVHKLTSPGRHRAMTAVWLLGPQTPLLFQGQEFAASSPFLYFNDAPPDEADNVRSGRAKFLAQFRSLATKAMQANLSDPCDAANFERCRLNFTERESHIEAYALHRDLLALRHGDAVLGRMDEVHVDGAAVDRDVFFLRYFGPDGQDRLLVVNLGSEARFDSIAHPLVAPPAGRRWAILWSSENRRYGGQGMAEADTADGWRLAAESATLLHPLLRDRNDE